MTGGQKRLPTLREVLARVHFRVTLFAVGMAGLTVLLTGFATIIGYAQQNLDLIAQTASYSVAPAIVFNDPDAARETIAPLAATKGVAEIIVIAGDGHRLAVWRRPASGASLDRWLAHVVAPSPATAAVRHDGATIGEVRVIGDGDPIIGYMVSGVIGALACLVITAIATHFLARSLQQSVIEPLDAIAAVAHAVRGERAFDRRAPSSTIAEIDSLGDDFNALLSELEAWQHDLRREHETLSHRATHDALTALPNRLHFEQQLDAALQRSAPDGTPFAVLFLDGNGFKAVNDRHGHAAGDAVLVEVAARLRACLRARDVAARLGGDEFAVLLDPPSGAEAASRIRTELAERMAHAIILPDGEKLTMQLSIGAACYPDDGTDVVTLMNRADAAMYAAKQALYAQQTKREGARR